MKKNSKKRLQSPMAMRLERIEQKTDRVLALLGNIYRQMSQTQRGSKDWAEAVDRLHTATMNLVSARHKKAI